MFQRLIPALIALAVATTSAQAAFNISFLESFNNVEDAWEYRVGITNSLGDTSAIVAFGVDNTQTQLAYTNRSGWSGEIYTAADWDNGVSVGYGAPGVPSFIEYFNTADVPTMAQLWGPGINRINFYWRSIYTGFHIGPNEDADDQFFYNSILATSTLVAFGPTGNVLPEPASLMLLLAAVPLIVGRKRS